MLTLNKQKFNLTLTTHWVRLVCLVRTLQRFYENAPVTPVPTENRQYICSFPYRYDNAEFSSFRARHYCQFEIIDLCIIKYSMLFSHFLFGISFRGTFLDTLCLRNGLSERFF